jgi:FAD/FMN-containing dehydrogenase
VSPTVNDIHSALNESAIREEVAVASLEAIRAAVQRAGAESTPVAVAGGRHAMGGQQFCDGGMLLDTRALDRVLDLDRERGIIEVEAGIQWPALIEYLQESQAGTGPQWGIAQKQTGADRLSIGGAIAANVHGRGLAMKPFVSDVESFILVSPDGEPLTCSRDENVGLFQLGAGGYGLFGCVYSARVRLVERQVLERIVEVRELEDLPALFQQRIEDGFLYGDFQFATDEASDDFLRRGVFSCYRPVQASGPPRAGQRALSRDDWQRLIYLAHADKAHAFEQYSNYYLTTSGQVYYSDAHQFADYADGYHQGLDQQLGSAHASTEMITEVYVPRDRLVDFMAAIAEDFRAYDVNVIYGTIRLIERDHDSFLAWATAPWVCVIFNLCVGHQPALVEKAADDFRRLIDRAIERGGKYYLTYHRWATLEQVETCYPQFREFLARKLQHDPDERFQSNWYRHHRDLFAG